MCRKQKNFKSTTLKQHVTLAQSLSKYLLVGFSKHLVMVPHFSVVPKGSSLFQVVVMLQNKRGTDQMQIL